ncbi:MAG: hypothetical protein Q7R39_07780 [Dehalococcoidia bacterium]|nr:hypothetical protein [Dehalococcoidia bacterium]
MSDILDDILTYMVDNSANGVFKGTPREQLGVSSGPLYRALYALGIQRCGRGRQALWTIPPAVLAKYRKHR